MKDHNSNNPHDTVENELVAYLDGELDAIGTQQIEERLGTDAAYRQQLQQLQRAWDLLDVLPRVSAHESFTRSTVEMVALSVEGDVEKLRQRGTVQKRWSWLCGGGGVLLAAVVGYFLVSTKAGSQNQRLLQQLPVIANLDLYRQIDSLDFLRTLEREKLFSSSNRSQVAYVRFDPQQTPADRSQKLSAASTSELEALRDLQERFNRLPAGEQQRLLRFHDELIRDPQAEPLQNTLERYDDWLRSQPSGRAAELRALPEPERLLQIQRMLKEQEENVFRRFADSPLPTEDRQAVLTWLESWLAKNSKRIEDQFPAFMRDRTREPDGGRRNLLFMYVGYLKQRHDRPGERPQDLIAPGPEDIRELEEKLSTESKTQLLHAREKNDEKRLVQEWTRAALLSKLVPPVSEDELLRFYREQLSAEDRQYLDSLPRDQFQRELRAKYSESNLRRWGGRPMLKGGPSNGSGSFNEGPRPFGESPRLPGDAARSTKPERLPDRREKATEREPRN